MLSNEQVNSVRIFFSSNFRCLRSPCFDDILLSFCFEWFYTNFSITPVLWRILMLKKVYSLKSRVGYNEQCNAKLSYYINNCIYKKYVPIIDENSCFRFVSNWFLIYLRRVKIMAIIIWYLINNVVL